MRIASNQLVNWTDLTAQLSLKQEDELCKLVQDGSFPPSPHGMFANCPTWKHSFLLKNIKKSIGTAAMQCRAMEEGGGNRLAESKSTVNVQM